MLQTINLCRDCYDYRLREQSESKVSNADSKDLIKQNTSRGKVVGRFRDKLFHQENVGAVDHPTRVGKAFVGGSSRKQTAIVKMSHHTRKSLRSCVCVIACRWKAP